VDNGRSAGAAVLSELGAWVRAGVLEGASVWYRPGPRGYSSCAVPQRGGFGTPSRPVRGPPRPLPTQPSRAAGSRTCSLSRAALTTRPAGLPACLRATVVRLRLRGIRRQRRREPARRRPAVARSGRRGRPRASPTHPTCALNGGPVPRIRHLPGSGIAAGNRWLASPTAPTSCGLSRRPAQGKRGRDSAGPHTAALAGGDPSARGREARGSGPGSSANIEPRH
jgi:hypothetical protein